jgi:hypothetical protein
MVDQIQKIQKNLLALGIDLDEQLITVKKLFTFFIYIILKTVPSQL